MAYTKGPWEPKTAEEWDNGFDFFAGQDKAFVFLADVGPEDASLIAAAPDLLEALEKFVKEYTEMVNSGDCGFWDPENEDKVKAARAAIAKAKGETK